MAGCVVGMSGLGREAEGLAIIMALAALTSIGAMAPEKVAPKGCMWVCGAWDG